MWSELEPRQQLAPRALCTTMHRLIAPPRCLCPESTRPLARQKLLAPNERNDRVGDQCVACDTRVSVSRDVEGRSCRILVVAHESIGHVEEQQIHLRDRSQQNSGRRGVRRGYVDNQQHRAHGFGGTSELPQERLERRLLPRAICLEGPARLQDHSSICDIQPVRDPRQGVEPSSLCPHLQLRADYTVARRWGNYRTLVAPPHHMRIVQTEWIIRRRARDNVAPQVIGNKSIDDELRREVPITLQHLQRLNGSKAPHGKI